MRLRAYTKEDSPVIAKWVRTEKELYQWSASIYGFYPLLPYSIDDNYVNAMKSGRFIPLTAVDDEGRPVGHFIIRYPNENDDSSVRIGFVIVDPNIRGKGCGRELMKLAVDYVKDNLTATRVDLGVFENNPKAKKCYSSVGFKDYGSHTVETPFGQWYCTDMELYL
ncbi:MAG: GNAT family N-acetyltransferase [Saccharofermentans sp.]|jgi:RimJ/RimL family protein N-acetyltransferase|nr:GNAT family N-acetyltransferase [Clostridiales bacterium]MCR5383282.1 GNAT family N-acetyltransferase [Saccharofermentans sp.]